jgi:DNA-binding transcriptional MerR regulator
MKKKDITKDFLTISEFSKSTGISEKSLRHYDNKGILIAAGRGNNYKNNYRLYSPSQIITAKFVRVLTDIGVPLETIKDLAEKRTPEKAKPSHVGTFIVKKNFFAYPTNLDFIGFLKIKILSRTY